jgi:hypothetical protein
MDGNKKTALTVGTVIFLGRRRAWPENYAPGYNRPHIRQAASYHPTYPSQHVGRERIKG